MTNHLPWAFIMSPDRGEAAIYFCIFCLSSSTVAERSYPLTRSSSSTNKVVKFSDTEKHTIHTHEKSWTNEWKETRNGIFYTWEQVVTRGLRGVGGVRSEKRTTWKKGFKKPPRKTKLHFIKRTSRHKWWMESCVFKQCGVLQKIKTNLWMGWEKENRNILNCWTFYIKLKRAI